MLPHKCILSKMKYQNVLTYYSMILFIVPYGAVMRKDRLDGLILKVIYHPLYSMNNFVTNKSKLPQDGAQAFPYMG